MAPDTLERAVPTLTDPALLRMQCYVDGAWRDADGGATMPVVNPATGRTIGTAPLFGAAAVAVDEIKAGYDPERINAVILLTDGINEDGVPDDDDAQFAQLTDKLRSSTEGEASTPVRVFTIAYGEDASTGQLSAIAEASNAAAYDSSDPDAIDQVFTAVVSNF